MLGVAFMLHLLTHTDETIIYFNISSQFFAYFLIAGFCLLWFQVWLSSEMLVSNVMF